MRQRAAAVALLAAGLALSVINLMVWVHGGPPFSGVSLLGLTCLAAGAVLTDLEVR